MKTIIFGACENGVRVKCMCEDSVYAFCDNDPKKQGLLLAGCPVISIDEVVNLSKEEKIKMICASIRGTETVASQLRERRAELELLGVSLRFLNSKIEHMRDFSEELFHINYFKPRLDYYEYHIAWQCNLRCKGCGHKSNVYNEKRMGNFEIYQKDIKRLKELFWGVKRIRLMGGEPLLNDKLCDFIITTREVFPDADIRIASNGLLVPNASERLFEAMRNTGAEFDFTLYPPTNEMKGRIELKCIEEHVFYSFSSLVDTFFSNIDIKGLQDKNRSYQLCKQYPQGSSSCHFLLDGCISTCCMPILHRENGDDYAFDTREDIIDIYDKELTGDSLLSNLSKPINACKYCNWDDVRRFEWQGYSKVTFENC